MPILESNADQPAVRSIVWVTALAVIFGLFFGLPPAFGASLMGLPWWPYCFSVILVGMVVGVFLAYLVVTFLVDTTFVAGKSLETESAECPAGPPQPQQTTVAMRLAEEKACLDRRDPAGQRIVWRELLDLELQDIDEQMSRICENSSASDEDTPKFVTQRHKR
jgi:hypothetical protein